MPMITLPAAPDQLAIVNAFIEKHLPAGHENILLQVQLAVEELLTNIYLHAYKEENGDAEIGCWMVNLDGKPYFCVMVRDFGEPFDPFAEAPEPDITQPLEERQHGGLGVYLIKHVAAHYCYSDSDSDNSNTIELYFSLPYPSSKA